MVFAVLFLFLGSTAVAWEAPSQERMNSFYRDLTWSWSLSSNASILSGEESYPKNPSLKYFSTARFGSPQEGLEAKEIEKAKARDEAMEDCFYSIVSSLIQNDALVERGDGMVIREITTASNEDVVSPVSFLLNANPAEQRELPSRARGTLVLSNDFFADTFFLPEGRCKQEKALEFLTELKSRIPPLDGADLLVEQDKFQALFFDDEVALLASQVYEGARSRGSSGHPDCATNRLELATFLEEEKRALLQEPTRQKAQSFVRELRDCTFVRHDLYAPVFKCLKPVEPLFIREMRSRDGDFSLGMTIPDDDYYSGKGLRDPSSMEIPAELQPNSRLAKLIHGLAPIEEISEEIKRINEQNKREGKKESWSFFRNKSSFPAIDQRAVSSKIEDEINTVLASVAEPSLDKKVIEEADALKEKKKKFEERFNQGRLILYRSVDGEEAGAFDQIFQVSYPLFQDALDVIEANSLEIMSHVTIERGRDDQSARAPNVARYIDHAKLWEGSEHVGYRFNKTGDSCFNCHSTVDPVLLPGADTGHDQHLSSEELASRDAFIKQMKTYSRQGFVLDASPYLDLAELPPDMGHPSSKKEREALLDAIQEDAAARFNFDLGLRDYSILSSMPNKPVFTDQQVEKVFQKAKTGGMLNEASLAILRKVLEAEASLVSALLSTDASEESKREEFNHIVSVLRAQRIREEIDALERENSKKMPFRKEAVLNAASSCVECHDSDGGKYRGLNYADFGLTSEKGLSVFEDPGQFAERSTLQAWLDRMLPGHDLSPLEAESLINLLRLEAVGGETGQALSYYDRKVHYGQDARWVAHLMFTQNSCFSDYIQENKARSMLEAVESAHD